MSRFLFLIGGNGSRYRGFVQTRREAAVRVGQKTDLQVEGGRRRPVAHRTHGRIGIAVGVVGRIDRLSQDPSTDPGARRDAETQLNITLRCRVGVVNEGAVRRKRHGHASDAVSDDAPTLQRERLIGIGLVVHHADVGRRRDRQV